MAIQEAFVALAKDKSLSGRPMRVLTYMMGRLDWDNYITLSQVEVAGELDLHRQHVHAAIKLLVERGIIQEGQRTAVPIPIGSTALTAGRVKPSTYGSAGRSKLYREGPPRNGCQRINKAGQQGVGTTPLALVTAQEYYAMTAEGYDYEYALTMISHDAGDYGTYSSTPTTSRIEVTVDPPLDVRLMSQGKGEPTV
jgi:hypothetical protein